MCLDGPVRVLRNSLWGRSAALARLAHVVKATVVLPVLCGTFWVGGIKANKALCASFFAAVSLSSVVGLEVAYLGGGFLEQLPTQMLTLPSPA